MLRLFVLVEFGAIVSCDGCKAARFMVGNPAVISCPGRLTEGDLTDITTDLSPAAGTIPNGWYIQLADFGDPPDSVGSFVGEKVLANSVTLQGVVLFTTFTPSTSISLTSCASTEGRGSVFAVSIADGSPVFDLDGLSSVNRADRTFNLVRTDPPASPSILFPPINGAPSFIGVGFGEARFIYLE